jgi:hypothetical protein
LLSTVPDLETKLQAVLRNETGRNAMADSIEQSNIEIQKRYFPYGSSQSISRHLLNSQLNFDVVKFLEDL